MHRVSDDRLPRVMSPNHLVAATEQRKKSPNLSTSLPLPHITSSGCYQSDTLAPPNHDYQEKGSPIVLQPGQNVFPVPLKQSEITQIVEAAKKSRDEKIAASLGLDKFGRAKRPHKKNQSKFIVFASPRTSINRSKIQQVLPQVSYNIAAAALGSRHTAGGGSTEVIDLETSDAIGAAVVVVESADVHMVSLQGQNTRSQPHLSTKKGATSKFKPNRNQKLRRPRSHTRMGGSLAFHTAPRLAAEQGEGRTISVSMEDVSGKVSHVQEDEPKPVQAGPEKKGGSISRPIVKRPNFAKQNTTKQSVKSQVHSVYGGRPYVIPVAKKILQQTKSMHHSMGAGGRTNDKRLSLNQYPGVKRRHQPLPRKEIHMPKGELWLVL